jgi:hypothetical protein
MKLFSFPVAPAGRQLPIIKDGAELAAWASSARHTPGGIAPTSADDAREAAIAQQGRVVEFFLAEAERAEARYRLSSCFADRGDMDAATVNGKAALRLMETLIKGRSPQMVERMEQERGLCGR